MLNLGASADLTPKVRLVGNANYIRFVETAPLELLLKQPNIREDVGVDVGADAEGPSGRTADEGAAAPDVGQAQGRRLVIADSCAQDRRRAV